MISFLSKRSRIEGAAVRSRRARRPLRIVPLLALAAILALVLPACTGAGTLAVERGWSAPVIDDGIIYIGSRSGEVIAIDVTEFPRGGGPLDLDDEGLPVVWRYPHMSDDNEFVAIYGTPVLTEDLVIIGLNSLAGRRDAQGVLTVLTKKPLENRTEPEDLVWDFFTDGPIFGSPEVYEGAVFVADDEGVVYSVDLESGRQNWRAELSDKRIWSSPTAVDGVVYIAAMDKHLYALDTETGDPVWDQPFAAGGAMASKPLVVGDLVYVGAFDRELHAVDIATGVERLSFKADHWIWNDPVVRDGIIYFGSLGGTFYALSADDLSEVWRFPRKNSSEEGDPIRASAVIADDRIFVANRSGAVFALDLIDGSEIRRDSVSVGEKVLASLAVAGDNLYVSDFDEMLHEFNIAP
jgi:outer membrane protein assembly factor BamB